MSEQEKLFWQEGAASDSLPPLIEMPDEVDEIQSYLELYRQHGPVFRVARKDQPVQTILIGPEANAFVAGHWERFFVSGEFWQDFGRAVGGEQGTEFTNLRDGEANRLRRAREGRCYSRSKVLPHIGRMQEIVSEQIQTWQQQPSIALLSAIQRITAEQLGQILVHHEVGDYISDIITFLYTSFENAVVTKNMAAFAEPAFLQAKERTQDLARTILAEHRAQPEARSQPDLLDEVLLNAAEHPDEYTEASLERAALKPFLLGIVTVAHVSSFMLYTLLNNQELLRRAQTEVDAALDQGPLTLERLKDLQTIYGTMMETLRLVNASNRHTLRVARPLTLAGYRLEAGDVVLVVSGAAHYLPEIFPEPETFDSERYHPPRNEHRRPGAFVPFGLGNHLCLGSGIAEIQLLCITATILHRYELAIDPPDYQLTPRDNALSPVTKQLRVKVIAERKA